MTEKNEMNAVNENVVSEVLATKEPFNPTGEKMMSKIEANSVDNATAATDTEQIAAASDSRESGVGTTQPVETTLALSEIQVREALRCRVQENEQTIIEYMERFVEYKRAVAAGEQPKYPFPPISVWHDGEQYILLGGFHRVAAARMAGIDRLPAVVFQGTEDKAFEIALQDNNTHGLRLSAGDKKYSIEKALLLFSNKMSLRAIAALAGCSVSYVSGIHKKLYTIMPPKEDVKIGRDGKKYPVKRKDANRVTTTACSIVANATKPAESMVDSKKEKQPDSNSAADTEPTFTFTERDFAKSGQTIPLHVQHAQYLFDKAFEKYKYPADRRRIYEMMQKWATERLDDLSKTVPR